MNEEIKHQKILGTDQDGKEIKLSDFRFTWIISGTGLANAKINGFSAMVFTISGFNAPALEQPKNTSAPLTASANVRQPLSSMA